MNIKIIHSQRRSLSMQVLSDDTIVVKAPILMPKIFIDKFIKDHQDWIEEQTEKKQVLKQKTKQYVEGEKYLFLGKEYKLIIGDYTGISFKDDKLLFPKVAFFRIEKELNNFYVKQSKQIITEQIELLSKEMGTTFANVSFSDTRSKWGSCTFDNRLQFSWRLVMAPMLVLKYVIIHELAHTKEKNHGRSFWSKVRLHNPSYRQQIKWLKDNGEALFI